ncbi:hypothetical protein KPH14_010710 [Odynerus spinipes]|uniref:Uncharacterized protein n=1 Tax=Odynerus spinipes TaxID=1348599 RepID=A0AAD9VUE7_9HYME|nr:hypothetical protein KPH14_010710 [Odynerus spinipes]
MSEIDQSCFMALKDVRATFHLERETDIVIYLAGVLAGTIALHLVRVVFAEKGVRERFPRDRGTQNTSSEHFLCKIDRFLEKGKVERNVERKSLPFKFKYSSATIYYHGRCNYFKFLSA